jgi:ubiquinone/menaquinone biosynthesis C-methylase UbiE
MGAGCVTSNRFIPAARLHLLTPVYDALCSAIGLGDRLRRFEMAYVPPVLCGSVLEVGCGTARFLAQVGRRHPATTLIAADIDPNVLELARKRLARGGLSPCFIRASAERMPLADASCDLVLSSLMLHHLPSRTKRAALSEWRRVLKDGGELLLFDFGVPRSRLTKILFWPLRFHLLEEQADNLRRLVPCMLAEAGLEYEEIGVYGSVIVAYRARRGPASASSPAMPARL